MSEVGDPQPQRGNGFKDGSLSIIIIAALLAGYAGSTVHPEGASILRGLVGSIAFFFIGAIAADGRKTFEAQIAAALIGMLILLVLVLLLFK